VERTFTVSGAKCVQGALSVRSTR